MGELKFHRAPSRNGLETVDPYMQLLIWDWKW